MDMTFLKEFENPSSIHRGAPFWAWNTRLNQDELLWQIDRLKEMGLGGFTIHSRIGLETPYMGEEFMTLVKACVEKARRENMQAYLYDEDRCPSGTAGGEVTKDRRFQGRRLVFTPVERPEVTPHTAVEEAGRLMARYEIQLKDGWMSGYRRLAEGEKGDNVWYAYLMRIPSFPYYNGQTYLDTLNPEAVEAFVQKAYEPYWREVGEEFGSLIPSIFTDEPQFYHYVGLQLSTDRAEAELPCTEALFDYYAGRYGEDLLDSLPELIWELDGGRVSSTRWRYHDCVTEMFVCAYADTVGRWCGDHGIALTGHMMDEHCLLSQTGRVGEAMRSYRAFQIPGIDILCDAKEYGTAKQAQSVVHQKGGREMTSELCGVTNWDYDFRGHKLQGDWQAALGVTHRVPHLAWVSMEGEGKRDYPASIGYQSPWYREYPLIENHFARLNTALKQGNPCVRVGVIHPIESYWLAFGPQDKTGALRDEMQRQFDQTVEWLLFGLIDFDFISEGLLPSQKTSVKEERLCVGEMAYDVIVVPNCLTLRRTTVELLQKMPAEKVLILGDSPRYQEGEKSPDLEELVNRCTRVSFRYTALMEALESYRCVDLRETNGNRTSNRIYQMRRTENGWWIFIANARGTANKDVPQRQDVTLTLWPEDMTGYRAVCFDTMNGRYGTVETTVEDGRLSLATQLYDHDSLLLYVTKESCPGEKAMENGNTYSNLREVGRLPHPSTFVLSEPNVLVLDQATYQLDDGEWEPREDSLYIDNILRTRLGYPLKGDACIQPWANTAPPAPAHRLKLRYDFFSHVEVPAKLALERPWEVQLLWNGEAIPVLPEGYFVDKSIHTVPLPGIRRGWNQLEVTVAYNDRTNLEWMYLLGDFGVAVKGDTAYITPMPGDILFGDWCTQGLPFYAGNVTYHCDIDVEEGRYILEAAKFRAPLLSVQLDGQDIGKIAFAPYRLDLGSLRGRHRVSITAYGCRINAFGQLHNCDEQIWWYGPETWRTEGERFCREYVLRRSGVLAAPRILRYED